MPARVSRSLQGDRKRRRRCCPDSLRLCHKQCPGRHVVDNTNYAPQGFQVASSMKLHVFERFTRTGLENIKYEFTIDDPDTWTRPWSVMIPLRHSPDKLFEYACHEGNTGLEGILTGARADEER